MRIFLILISLTLFGVARADCAEDCASGDARAFLCARDGKTYPDTCQAFCQGSDNYIIGSYQYFPEEQVVDLCKESARVHKCYGECGMNRSSAVYYCTNVGRIFGHLCKAKCTNPKTEFEWECSHIGYDPVNCHFKCAKYQKCKKQCAESEQKEEVCGSDGLMHASLCQVECNDLVEVHDFDGLPVIEKDQCLQFAKKYAADGLGPRQIK